MVVATLLIYTRDEDDVATNFPGDVRATIEDVSERRKATGHYLDGGSDVQSFVQA